MAINKLVSINKALVQLADETDHSVLEMKPVLIKWAKQADARIGSIYSYKTEYFLLKVENSKADLPLRAIYLDNMIFGDVLSNCPAVFDNLTNIMTSAVETASDEFIYTINEDAFLTYNVSWSVQDNKIVFQSNFKDGYVTVKMKTYPYDSDGVPYVLESHIEAIAIFLKAKIAEKQQFNKFKRSKLSNADFAYINSLKRDFVNQSRLSAVNDENYSEIELKESADFVNGPFTGSSNLY